MAQFVNLSSSPNQVLNAPLSINGSTTVLQLSVSWNRIGQFWAMSVADSRGNVLVSPVPLITGVWPASNILMPYQYMNIGTAFVINLSGTSVDYPNDTNLGTDFQLLWDNNDGYVNDQPFGGNVYIVGPPGAQGLPGVVGGLSIMGTSGSQVPALSTGILSYQATLTGNITIATPITGSAGQVFVIWLIQPVAGNCTATFSSYYRGLSSFSLDTTGSTQAVFWFQVDSTNTFCTLIDVAQNGNPIS